VSPSTRPQLVRSAHRRLAAHAGTAAAPVGDCQAGTDWPASLPATAADVVERVNAHRADRGLAPLAVSPTLTAAAEWKARHVAHYGYMQHDDPAPEAAVARVLRPPAHSWDEPTTISSATPVAVSQKLVSERLALLDELCHGVQAV